ncbi:hypothetical protein ACIHCV_35365 [Streptomyces sp. NPDC051956]|uniref:GntT/GntP/DsdX family permease n=1 Tax=Streptomyces sp. NPDC051956 TaxID=3365677 RepID=UPI0037D0FF56
MRATCCAAVPSHINDADHWMFTKFVGLDVGTGLRTWTVLTTAMGVTGFALTAVLWQVVQVRVQGRSPMPVGRGQ